MGKRELLEGTRARGGVVFFREVIGGGQEMEGS